MGATGRPQPLCHQETRHHCEYMQSSRLLQGHHVSMGGAKLILNHAYGLCRGEREGRSLNVQSLYHRK